MNEPPTRPESIALDGRTLRGKLEVAPIESRLLQGNPLGDAVRREVLVYLPPGYDGNRRLPTVMVLPGFGSNHRSMVAYDLWKPNLVQRYERLLRSPGCREAILVLPDATTCWGGSQFLDSTATGLYQSYLADEVIPWVDRRYQTIPRREARAVVGRSSGGFGALRLGMDRPELFSVLGSHAGDAAFEISVRPLFIPAALTFERHGGLESFCQQIRSHGPEGADFDALFLVAAAAAYAPEPKDRKAPHAALPFDLRTTDLIPEVWERWLAHDPLERIEGAQEALRSMRFIYLDAGGHDEYGLQFAARRLAQRLARIGAPVKHEEFPGGHRGTSYRYSDSLPLLISALAAD